MKLLSLLLISFFLNCALFQKKNLRLVYAVEENLVPENNTLKIVAAPVYLPLGIAGGILDVFLVHPLSVIPDATLDTINTIWKNRESGYVTRMGAIPFLTLASPIYFTLSWMHHWLFKDYNYEYTESERPESLSPEKWTIELSKKTNQLRTKNEEEDFSVFMQDCSLYVDEVNLSQQFESILLNSQNENLHRDVVNCISTSNKKWAFYEMVLIQTIQKRNKNLELYADPLTWKKSIKGSAAIVEKLSQKDLPEEEFRTLVYSLLRIEHKPHLQELQRRIQSTKK